MKTTGVIEIIEQPDINVAKGHFNGGEHLFIKIEPGKNQTVSCLLPNGKFVTFAFVPGSPGSEELECVDIHTTVGKPFPRGNGWGPDAKAYPQQLIGFTPGSGTFDTRKIEKPTTLATLLLDKKHYAGKDGAS